MTYRFKILPEAREEFDAEVDWYKAKNRQVAKDFVAAINGVFAAIRAQPKMHAADKNGVRKAVVRRFPFVIRYRIDGSEVIVSAVSHTSRNPDDLRGRN
jgi:toxin ParE1/3/4